MADTINPIAGQPVKRDGGTVMVGGTIANTRWKKIDYGNKAFSNGANPAEASANIQKAADSRSFGVMSVGKWVIVQACSEIGGVADTSLLKPGQSTSRNSIYYREGITTTKQNTAGFNWATGAYLTTPDVSTDSYGTDNSARVTWSAPGKLFVQTEPSAPLVLSYKARTLAG